VLALNAFVPQRLRPLPDTWTREHLLAVTELVEAEKLTPSSAGPVRGPTRLQACATWKRDTRAARSSSP
jgi:hypothetical protein